MDIAASIQAVTEEIILKMAGHVHKETGQKNLCLAGGVALNCVANGRVLREGPFENIWIQPAAGDAGGAVGAALSVWHRYLGNGRTNPQGNERPGGAYLGPAFSMSEVRKYLDDKGCPYRELDVETRAASSRRRLQRARLWDTWPDAWNSAHAHWGRRSILGDPRSVDTQSVMNLKIKYRESFRPFAPSVAEEKRIGLL